MRPANQFDGGDSAARIRRRIKRLLTLPLVLVAVVLVLFDDLFRPWVKAAVGRLARLPLWRWVESRIERLSPYATLALFLIPVAIIEPLKIYALYLMGLGHALGGILTLVVAKIVGVGLAERLFAIGRDKLLSIAWFAWCFERAVAFKTVVHDWIIQSQAWTLARRLAARAHAALRRARAWASRTFGGREGRLARQVAALRLRLAGRKAAHAGLPAQPLKRDRPHAP